VYPLRRRSRRSQRSQRKRDLVTILREAIRDIPSYKGSGEVEDLVNVLKKNEDSHEEVELSDVRKIKIAMCKLTGNASALW
jgi:hypothetical protein